MTYFESGREKRSRGERDGGKQKIKKRECEKKSSFFLPFSLLSPLSPFSTLSFPFPPSLCPLPSSSHAFLEASSHSAAAAATTTAPRARASATAARAAAAELPSQSPPLPPLPPPPLPLPPPLPSRAPSLSGWYRLAVLLHADAREHLAAAATWARRSRLSLPFEGGGLPSSPGARGGQGTRRGSRGAPAAAAVAAAAAVLASISCHALSTSIQGPRGPRELEKESPQPPSGRVLVFLRFRCFLPPASFPRSSSPLLLLLLLLGCCSAAAAAAATACLFRISCACSLARFAYSSPSRREATRLSGFGRRRKRRRKRRRDRS